MSLHTAHERSYQSYCNLSHFSEPCSTHRVADDADRIACCQAGHATREARTQVDEAGKERVILAWRERTSNQNRDNETVDGDDSLQTQMCGKN